MATTAFSGPRLQVPASDIMDTHSDGGLDFGDGDIELDLDAEPHRQCADDDVSNKAAAAGAGEDAQLANAEQDDYMVDNEDVIQEDDVQYQDGAAIENIQQDDSNSFDGDPMLAPDEDLIDYLDDEDFHPPDDHGAPVLQNSENSSTTRKDAAGDRLQATIGTEAYEWPSANEYGNHDLNEEAEYAFEYGVGDDVPDQATVHNIEDPADDQSDEHEGEIALETHEEQEVHDHNDDINEGNHDGSEQHVPAASRPIIVDYEGNELWLLKEHDSDESGDWLLEDRQLVTSSLSDLLQACRSALGEDISAETELGLRFDHLHGMELFEDNTACVAVSLERLVTLYHTLHAQEGNEEPDSFYMGLLSRPRFATLLADVAKQAEEGNGYSGLMHAIAAGETHFPDTFSTHSTEHETTEYENDDDEYEDQQADGDVEPHAETQSRADSEQSQQHVVYERPDEGKTEGENEEEEDSVSPDDDQHTEQSPSEHVQSPVHTNADADADADDADEVVAITLEQQHSHVGIDAQLEQGKHDTIEYSDEDRAEAPERPSNALSQTSSTVQGDDEQRDMHSSVHVEGSEHVDNAQNNEPAVDQKESGEIPFEPYEDYNYSLDNTEGVYLDHENDQGNDTGLEGFGNEEFANFDYDNVDNQVQEDYNNDGQDTSLMANDFDGGNESFQFNDQAEWDVEQVGDRPDDSFLTYEGESALQEEQEENGVAEHTAVAVLVTADQPAIAPLESEDTSQRLKRSIDDVGDDVVNPPDSPENKRPRV